jgi:hypothetical protein
VEPGHIYSLKLKKRWKELNDVNIKALASVFFFFYEIKVSCEEMKLKQERGEEDLLAKT